MNHEEPEDLAIEIDTPVDGKSLPSGFSHNEAERNRRFEYGTHQIPRVGRIEQFRLTTVGRSNNSGQVTVSFVEVIEHLHAPDGTGTLILKDDAGNAIHQWNIPIIRQCGRHSRSYSQSLTAEQAIRCVLVSIRSGELRVRRC